MSENKCAGIYIGKSRKIVDLVNALELNNDGKHSNNNISKKLKRQDILNNTNYTADDNETNLGVSSSGKMKRVVDNSLENDGVTIGHVDCNANANDIVLLSKDELDLSWKKIVVSFTSIFENVITENSKLYFDIACKKIDGATVKWCPIILLDTLISIKLGRNEILKRKFNQYNALRQAICDVVSESYVALCYRKLIQTSNNNYENNSNIDVFPIDINIIDIPNHWILGKDFKAYSCNLASVSKSNRKMNGTVDILISHDVIKGIEIIELIKTVATNIYKQHFIEARLNSTVGLHRQGLNGVNERQTSTVDNNSRYVISFFIINYIIVIIF